MQRSPDAGANDQNRTGHTGLDGEYVVQVGLIDALVQAFERRLDPSVLRSILDQLLDHTRVLFLSEQLLMRLHAYPAYERHLREHENLAEKLFELSELQRTGSQVLTDGTPRRLRSQLMGHIRSHDLELINFLQRGSLEARGS